MLDTIKIVNPVTGDGYTIINAADFDPAVHRALEAVPTSPAIDDPFAAMSDAELRAFIEEKTGTAPHHRTGRETLMRLASEAT